MASNKKKKKEFDSVGWQSMILPTIIGTAATVILTVLLVLIFGRLAYGTQDPSKYSRIIGLAALYVSVFVGGLLASAFRGKSIASSALHGAIVTLVLIIADAVGGGISADSLIMELLAPLSSLLGGAAYSVRPKKRKKPKFRERGR